MKTLLRVFLTAISALSGFYFVFWIGSAILLGLGLPFWLASLLALAAATAAGRYVWAQTESLQGGLVSSIVLGAVSVGGIGFGGGFFGPLIFAPEANQGPLLGIFITGPLGFILGAIGGAIYWFVRGRHRVQPLPASTAR